MRRTFRRQPPVGLKSIDQFRTCTKAQLRGVARLAEQVKVDQGEILVKEGQSGRELFLILDGTVEVMQSGRRVNALGPCDFFGELGALNRGPRSATVTALSDLELLVIGPREFDSLAQIPGFRNALFKRLANRLRSVDARLAAADGEQALCGQDSQRQDWPSTSTTSAPGQIANEARSSGA
jgi:CRP/FNR family transcriptional regulator, cyclic AMP receptor protein